MIDIENAKKVFNEYVSNYNLNDGKIALKVGHILRVAENSKKIATDLNLSQEDIELAEFIGLMHDIGRFEQIKLFNTFRDNESINHGEFGVKVLFEDGLINKFNIDEKYYKTIKLAILNHNRKKIEDGLTENELLHCKIIRDSDKLDIFYVLITDKFIDAYNCESMENETFTEEIIREFYEDRMIDYPQMVTHGDLWIAHQAYVFDFNFKSCYKVMHEKDYINKLFNRIGFKDKKTLEEAKKIVKDVNEYIEEKVHEA